MSVLRASLFWKTFGSCLALIVLTAIVAGWIASRGVLQDVESETDTALAIQLDLIHELVSHDFPTDLADGFQERIRALGERTGTRITVIAAGGRVLADSSRDPRGMDDHGQRPEVVASRNAAFGRSSRYSDTLGMQMAYMARAVRMDGRLVGYVRAALPLVHLESRMRTLRNTVLGAAAFAVLIGLLGALAAARALARPLTNMRDAATAIAGGDLRRRVHTRSSDEVGELGRAFNEMASRLEREITTIRRDERELSAILSGMVEGVLAVDAREHIVRMNEAAADMLGVEPDDMRGRPIWEALRLPQIPETIARAVKQGAVQSAVLELPQKTLRLHVGPLRGGDDEGSGAILVLSDVTERRRLDEIRRDFVANASHELQTPIAAIRGIAETILDDPGMDEETQRGFVESVLRQSHRLGDLVAEMLALSRLESRGEPDKAGSVDIGAAIDEVVQLAAPLASERQVTVEREVEGGSLAVRAQAEAIRRIAGNLLDNALAYSPRGGRVVVSARPSNGEVVLEVRDSGPGIPEDKHDRVFERFYRVDEGRAREAGGTGLGLAIVKHLVQSLGGRVELESRPGKGSTFRVSLPAA